MHSVNESISATAFRAFGARTACDLSRGDACVVALSSCSVHAYHTSSQRLLPVGQHDLRAARGERRSTQGVQERTSRARAVRYVRIGGTLGPNGTREGLKRRTSSNSYLYRVSRAFVVRSWPRTNFIFVQDDRMTRLLEQSPFTLNSAAGITIPDFLCSPSQDCSRVPSGPPNTGANCREGNSDV